VVGILSLFFSHHQCLTLTSCFLDSPEVAPGAILGPSGATVPASGTRTGATSGQSSSTATPTPSPTQKSSSNTGAIVGGVVGGVAVISLVAIAIGFFLRQRPSQAPAPVTPAVVSASQPPMDEIQHPLTTDDGYTSSSVPGTIGTPSMSGTPLTPPAAPPAAPPIRLYVRVYVPNWPSRFCVLISCSFLLFFLTLRTRMIHLHFLGTKLFLRRRPRQLKARCHRSVGPETHWPPCRPHGNRVTMACLLSDSALRRHRIVEESESGMQSVSLSDRNRLSFIFVCVQLRRWFSLLYCRVMYPETDDQSRTARLNSLCDSLLMVSRVLSPSRQNPFIPPADEIHGGAKHLLWI